MKKVIISVFLAICFLTISCGSKENKAKEEKTVEDTVDMTVKYKYNEVDTFKVYYTKADGAAIDGSLMMTLPVKPSENEQELTFIFPVGDYPKIIRLDVGNNQKAESIEIKSITITQGDNVIDNSDWITTNNWTPNESLAFDNKSKAFKITPVNGVKVPVLMSNIIIKDKMDKYSKSK